MVGKNAKGVEALIHASITKTKVMSLTLATMEARATVTHESIGEAYHKYSSTIKIVGLMQLIMENPLHPHPWQLSLHSTELPMSMLSIILFQHVLNCIIEWY
jgi:hypothetical protein